MCYLIYLLRILPKAKTNNKFLEKTDVLHTFIINLKQSIFVVFVKDEYIIYTKMSYPVMSFPDLIKKPSNI